jgi:hypothetical protein
MGPTVDQMVAELEAEKARRVRAEELLELLLGGDTPPVLYGRIGPGEGVPSIAVTGGGGRVGVTAVEGRLAVLLNEYLGVAS